MEKEIIIAIFDKVSSREEFVSLIDQVYAIEARALISRLSASALKLIDSEIVKEEQMI
jgi:hypothetical protein